MITNNVFRNWRQLYRYVEDIYWKSNYYDANHNVTFEKNTFDTGDNPNWHNKGIHIINNATQNHHYFILKKNTFHNTHSPIYIEAGRAHLQILQNEINNGSRAIYFSSNGSYGNSKVIENNIISNIPQSDTLNAIDILGSESNPVQFKGNAMYNISGTVITMSHPNILIMNNLFYTPNALYNVKFTSTSFVGHVLNATLNYWNTTNLHEISRKIYDVEYNDKYPKIIWRPFLASENISDIIDGVWSFVNGNKIGGTVNGNITLDLSMSPYTVETNIIVAADDVLTVKAGVELHFQEGVGITVEGECFFF